MAPQKTNEEKQKTDKKIPPEWRHLRSAPPGVEIRAETAWLEKQSDYVAEKFLVEVEEIFECFKKSMTKRAMNVEIVLAAAMTKGAVKFFAAVLAKLVDGLMVIVCSRAWRWDLQVAGNLRRDRSR